MNPETEKLKERDVRRGLRINIVAGSLGMVWAAAAMGIPLTMFLEALGASGLLIGLSVTVQQVAMLVQVPSALLTGRLRRRKALWGPVVIVQRAIWVIPALLPFWMLDDPQQMARLVVALVALSSVLMHVAAASWWSWMTDLVPEGRRGAFWGLRQTVVTAVHMVAVWGAGRLLDIGAESGSYAGFQIVFLLAALLGTLDVVVHYWVPEPRAHPASTGSVGRDLLRPFQRADFRWLTISMGLWLLGLGVVGQYGFLHLRRDYGVTYADLALTAVSASLGVAVFGIIWGYVMDRVGPRTLCTINMMIAPVFSCVWFFMHPGVIRVPLGPWQVSIAQPVLLLLCANFFAGAVYSGVGLAQVGLLGTAAPREGRTLAMAVHWSSVGLMAAVGPLAAGLVMDYFEAHPVAHVLPTGTRISFFHILLALHALVTWALAVPCLRRVAPQAREVPVRVAAARLFPTNPMRAIGSLHDIYALGRSGSSDRVARAVRRVGEKRSTIAVQDLIERLDDPSADVREEAVLALGRIGCPEAVDALVHRLEDPEGDALPQVARALREALDRRSVSALVSRLDDDDRETVTEAARALGAIGDRAAATALLRLLRGSTDAKVSSAASDALARLGELAAAHEILPRMLQACSPVLRASLAAAAADLVGEAGAFYKLNRRERQARGEGVSAILSALRSDLKRKGDEHETERRALADISVALEAAYEAADATAARQRLVELTTGLAALRYGIHFGPDASVVGDVLVWHNQRLGIAAWYTSLLAQADDERPSHEIDLLLGIFFLTVWDGADADGVKEPAESMPPG